MTSRSDIRQQNAERRLSHAVWAHEEASGGTLKSIIAGAALALLVIMFFAVRA